MVLSHILISYLGRDELLDDEMELFKSLKIEFNTVLLLRSIGFVHDERTITTIYTGIYKAVRHGNIN